MYALPMTPGRFVPPRAQSFPRLVSLVEFPPQSKSPVAPVELGIGPHDFLAYRNRDKEGNAFAARFTANTVHTAVASVGEGAAETEVPQGRGPGTLEGGQAQAEISLRSAGRVRLQCAEPVKGACVVFESAVGQLPVKHQPRGAFRSEVGHARALHEFVVFRRTQLLLAEGVP